MIKSNQWIPWITFLFLLISLQARRRGRGKRPQYESLKIKQDFEEYDESTRIVIFTFIGIIFLFLVTRQIQIVVVQRKLVQKIMKDYGAKTVYNICTLDQKEKNNAINWFMNNCLTFSCVRGGVQSQHIDLKINNLKKKNQNLYSFTMEDRNVRSKRNKLKYFGLLTFQNNKIALCFYQSSLLKSLKYDKNKNIKFQIFKGVQKEQMIIGDYYSHNKWLIYHNELPSQYLGQWRIAKKQQQEKYQLN